ncbi:MAG: hypothetical protein MJ105_09465 [Lachnospiraceae bacterium]|nr:hypothetical protein [Lachnospiraceae bacterium]
MEINSRLPEAYAAGVFPSAKMNIQGQAVRDAKKSVASQVKTVLEDRRKNRMQKSAVGLQVTTYTDKDGNVHRTYTGTTTSVVDTMKKYAEKQKKEEKKVKKSLHYNYYSVSAQIVSAKNSVSASKAVLSARRGLAELKRKLKTADCSEDEKQAALAHANQMLRIAKKKKKNLEMEELIHTTMKSDENTEKMNAAVEESQNIAQEGRNARGEDEAEPEEANNEVADYASQDFPENEELWDENLLTEGMEALAEEMDAMSPEELDAFVEELAESLQELSEAEEDLMDMMEVVNPHMDKEQFEKLKTKHRCDEQKELVKADTDYLKAYLKSVQAGGGSLHTESGNAAATNMVSMVTDAAANTAGSLGFVCSL